MKNFKHNYLVVAILATTLLTATSCQKDDSSASKDAQLEKLLKTASNNEGRSFFILPDGHDFSKIPQDPNNPITSEKVELGRMLFHETCIGRAPQKVESIETYSCASCHHVDAGFQAGVAQGIGEGGIGFGIRGEKRHKSPTYSDLTVDVQPLRTPAALNVAFQELMLWNGQFGAVGKNKGTENLWTLNTPKEKNKLGFHGVETQAIAGMGVHRLKIDVVRMANMPQYSLYFNLAYANLPADKRMTEVNAGLAIAAYERTLLANQAPFQKWLRGDVNAMNDNEKDGAILFFGKGGCVSCHTGPALNQMEFYALGMNDLTTGHYGAVNSGEDKPDHKGRGSFTGRAEDLFKFKVPQLYNLKDSPFYGHGSQFTSIKDVIDYKNTAISTNSKVPKAQLATEFRPLSLTADEVDKIRQFIETGLYDPNLRRYVPRTLPSGNCFPNNDASSRVDKGCN